MWLNSLICLKYDLPVLSSQAESVLRRRRSAYRKRLSMLYRLWIGTLVSIILFPSPPWALSVLIFTAFLSFSILDESVSS